MVMDNFAQGICFFFFFPFIFPLFFSSSSSLFFSFSRFPSLRHLRSCFDLCGKIFKLTGCLKGFLDFEETNARSKGEHWRRRLRSEDRMQSEDRSSSQLCLDALFLSSRSLRPMIIKVATSVNSFECRSLGLHGHTDLWLASYLHGLDVGARLSRFARFFFATICQSSRATMAASERR